MDIRIERTPHRHAMPPPEALGFGKVFTDHMFRAQYTPHEGWHDAAVVPRTALVLDPASSVLHYGQAVFEGLKAFPGLRGSVQLFRPALHARRLARSADRLCLPQVPEELFLRAVSTLVALDAPCIPRAPDTSLYIRPTLIGTEAFLGVRPSTTAEFFIIACPVGAYWQGGRRPLCIFVETELVRAASGGTGAAKFPGNYAASLLAAERAKAHGFDQVLWTDARTHQELEEIGTMNLFVRLGDTIVTPPLTDTILEGATRDSALTLLREWGIPVEERPITMSELEARSAEGQLREMFGTGTAAVIAPIGQLGIAHRTITVGDGKEGEITSRLYDAIRAIQYGAAEDRHHWLLEVSPLSDTGTHGS